MPCTLTFVLIFESNSRQKNPSKRDQRDISGFFDIDWTKKSKQTQHGFDLLHFSRYLVLLKSKSVLKSLYDVQLVSHVQLWGHKFHKNGKKQKKQSV